MKHLKTQKQLNEASENLNITDVMSSILKELDILKNNSEDKMDKFNIGSNLTSSFYVELGKSWCIDKVKEIISKYYS